MINGKCPDREKNSTNHLDMNIKISISNKNSNSKKINDLLFLENGKIKVEYIVGNKKKVFAVPVRSLLPENTHKNIRDKQNFLPQSRLKVLQSPNKDRGRIQIFVDSMITSVLVAESRDNTSVSHIIKMSCLIELIANELLEIEDFKDKDILTNDFIEALKFASLLHDLGKLLIPEKILQKREILNRSERITMNEHTQLGLELLKNFVEPNLRVGKLGKYCKIAEEIIKYHHAYYIPSQEFYIGTNILKGYPRNIQKTDIPLSARIAAVSDVFEALTSMKRLYPCRTKKGLLRDFSIARIMNVMSEEKGHFDPYIFKALKRLWKKNKLSEIMYLNVNSEKIDEFKEDFFEYLLNIS